MPSDCRNPVSYTHLDVYKRQEYGIPIINKRIAVTPIAMVAGACPGADPIHFAKALNKAASTVGVNFIGGYSALVHKGFAPGDYALIKSIPEALSETELVCSSVNIGTTKAGINMDAVKKMGEVILDVAKATADRDCIGAAKLVVFCNAPEDNPFMAGAFHLSLIHIFSNVSQSVTDCITMRRLWYPSSRRERISRLRLIRCV